MLWQFAMQYCKRHRHDPPILGALAVAQSARPVQYRGYVQQRSARHVAIQLIGFCDLTA